MIQSRSTLFILPCILCFLEVIILKINAQNCSITVSGPKPNKPCVFPFEFSRKKHWSCIDLKDPGNFWCSTKVDTFGKHIGGAREWGYCHKSCDGSIPAPQTNIGEIGKISFLKYNNKTISVK